VAASSSASGRPSSLRTRGGEQRRRGLVDVDLGPGGPGPLDQQPDGAGPPDGLDVALLVRAGRVERTDGADHLALDGEALPARRQHDGVGGGAQQLVHQAGDGVDDVLAVVEHQQRAPARQRLGQPGHRRHPRPVLGGLADGQRGQDDLGDHRRRAPAGAPLEAGELDQPRAVGEAVGHPAGRLQGQARLADAPGPGERD